MLFADNCDLIGDAKRRRFLLFNNVRTLYKRDIQENIQEVKCFLRYIFRESLKNVFLLFDNPPVYVHFFSIQPDGVNYQVKTRIDSIPRPSVGLVIPIASKGFFGNWGYSSQDGIFRVLWEGVVYTTLMPSKTA